MYCHFVLLYRKIYENIFDIKKDGYKNNGRLTVVRVTKYKRKVYGPVLKRYKGERAQNVKLQITAAKKEY